MRDREILVEEERRVTRSQQRVDVCLRLARLLSHLMRSIRLLYFSLWHSWPLPRLVSVVAAEASISPEASLVGIAIVGILLERLFVQPRPLRKVAPRPSGVPLRLPIHVNQLRLCHTVSPQRWSGAQVPRDACQSVRGWIDIQWPRYAIHRWQLRALTGLIDRAVGANMAMLAAAAAIVRRAPR